MPLKCQVLFCMICTDFGVVKDRGRVFWYIGKCLSGQWRNCIWLQTGSAYVDVGTIGGYRDAMQMLVNSKQNNVATQGFDE